MPGMNTGLSATNPVVVAAFHRLLLRQGLVILVVLAALWVVWNVLRSRRLRASASAEAPNGAVPLHGSASLGLAGHEPGGRRALRVSFGLFWIFDGVLQGQASMPLGMAPSVIGPAASTSPGWVQHIDNAMATIWSYHPISAPAAAVWVQVGIGLWLLVAPRGNWSRLAGVASVGWGLVVWTFGEAFGQVFASGQSFLFGLPGAVLFYCVAGALVALPEQVWRSERTGRRIIGAVGVFLLGMATLQAWPGRGFWQGGTAGKLASMTSGMAQTPQPHLTSSLVSAFAGFDAAHGWGVNLFAVAAMAVLGAGLLHAGFFSLRPRLLRVCVTGATVLFLADWVLVQDLGFLGGVGTDPNSMIPILAIVVAGYVAATRPAAQPAPNVVAIAAPARSPLSRLALDPTFALRVAASLAAIAVVLVGSVPAAVAATDPNADPILAQAINGTPQVVNAPAPNFTLIDQYGDPVTPADLTDKTVAVTFLDDVCTSTCPLIAQYFRQADRLLGPAAAKVELVAINANPMFVAPEFLQAFDRQENMASLGNWKFLTGSSLPQLEAAWRAFGNATELSPGGAMVGHSEFTAIIGPGWTLHYVLNSDPGPGTEATQSSFAVLLADTLRKVAAAS